MTARILGALVCALALAAPTFARYRVEDARTA